MSDALMATVVHEYYELHGLTYPEVLTACGATADLFFANYSGLAKIPMPSEQKKRLTENQLFEIHYRKSRGESGYSIAKVLGIRDSTVSRVINGEKRARRKPIPPLTGRLESDSQLKSRYELWVMRRELVPEGMGGLR